MRPGPILADPPLTGHVRRSPHRASRVATTPLRTHPAATTPVESPSPAITAFPVLWPGRLPHQPFRGLHSVRFSLRSACSPSHLRDPLHRRLRPLRLLHDRSDYYRLERKFAGWDCPPTGESRLSTAHHKCGTTTGFPRHSSIASSQTGNSWWPGVELNSGAARLFWLFDEFLNSGLPRNLARYFASNFVGGSVPKTAMTRRRHWRVIIQCRFADL
jgi:hypothetical protein